MSSLVDIDQLNSQGPNVARIPFFLGYNTAYTNYVKPATTYVQPATNYVKPAYNSYSTGSYPKSSYYTSPLYSPSSYSSQYQIQQQPKTYNTVNTGYKYNTGYNTAYNTGLNTRYKYNTGLYNTAYNTAYNTGYNTGHKYNTKVRAWLCQEVQCLTLLNNITASILLWLRSLTRRLGKGPCKPSWTNCWGHSELSCGWWALIIKYKYSFCQSAMIATAPRDIILFVDHTCQHEKSK